MWVTCLLSFFNMPSCIDGFNSLCCWCVFLLSWKDRIVALSGHLRQAVEQFVSRQLQQFDEPSKFPIFSVGSVPLQANYWQTFALLYWLEQTSRSSPLTAQELGCLLRRFAMEKCCAKCFASPDGCSQPTPQVVSLCLCEGCHVISYCSYECQQSHHKQHMKYCAALYDLRQQEQQRQTAPAED